MAKRFTDSDKWKRPTFRKLPPEFKLLYQYIQDNADHAGLWEEDLELAEFQTGLKKLDSDKVRAALAELIVVTCQRDRVRYFLPEFIFEQYGENLNFQNKVHASVIEKLERHGINYNPGAPFTYTVQIIEGPNMGQASPYVAPNQGAMDKDKEKDKDKINNNKASNFKKVVDRFAEFWKSPHGVPGTPFVFGAADGAAAKQLLEYLEGLDSVQSGQRTAPEVWDYILTHWGDLEPFYQKQIKLRQIVANLPNIIRQLNPKNRTNGKQKPTNEISELANAIRANRSGAVS